MAPQEFDDLDYERGLLLVHDLLEQHHEELRFREEAELVRTKLLLGALGVRVQGTGGAPGGGEGGGPVEYR